MDRRALLERFKVERIHVAPRALELSPLKVQRRFSHVWAPLEDLLRQLRPFPAGLVRFWLEQPGGHVVITYLPSRYAVGEQRLKEHSLRHVAYVGLSDLADGSLEALVPIATLFALGYGFDAEACRDVRSYFARSLALYLHDRHTLNVADPRMERLLRTTLFADAFWHFLQSKPPI